MEHVLWPCKITGTLVPNFVIPIRPHWATDLFDASLARNRLWGADEELALNPDSVYYRAIKPKVLGNQGRILWYISSDKSSGTKSIRACSQFTNTVIGKPKDIYRRFRRFGVYEWRHVLKAAGSSIDGEVMAIEFTDTELFNRRVNWDTIQSVLLSHGKKSTFPSPVAVAEELFLDLYHLGTSATA